ncbi:alpha/beta fold hydrolase [Microbacterium sp. J1-1]|uniref:alpha/beta hydrolase family protein n=1 Tax=Microbacterium sp. J1-1 TaxID=2992441 RepID=UPI0021145AB9|nr:alpha/beta fold hydrolase [Microbacterium sp. J1-1]UUE19374.1 alpha/beta fold hydrolase [Microbacterium sp. J1-1]
MTDHEPSESASPGWEDVSIRCNDGQLLQARRFHSVQLANEDQRAVIIAPATGVQGRYYWRFATYLAENGFDVLVPDFRGIGRSAPSSVKDYRKSKTRWHEWGTHDIEACILWFRDRLGYKARIGVVGHSFGGFAALLAAHASELDRILLVGAQHAHWPDYDKSQRLKLFMKWHLFMPIVSTMLGYFPGRRLGWLENLPRGVALDWARGAANYEKTLGADGKRIMHRISGLTIPVLSVNPTDDPYATRDAARRTLRYLSSAECEEWYPHPRTLGVSEIGHFGLFHQRFETTFWPKALDWLKRA